MATCMSFYRSHILDSHHSHYHLWAKVTNQIILGPAKGANADDACGHWMIRIRAFLIDGKFPEKTRVKFALNVFGNFAIILDPAILRIGVFSAPCRINSLLFMRSKDFFHNQSAHQKTSDGSRHFSSARVGCGWIFLDRIGPWSSGIFSKSQNTAAKRGNPEKMGNQEVQLLIGHGE